MTDITFGENKSPADWAIEVMRQAMTRNPNSFTFDMTADMIHGVRDFLHFTDTRDFATENILGELARWANIASWDKVYATSMRSVFEKPNDEVKEYINGLCN